MTPSRPRTTTATGARRKPAKASLPRSADAPPSTGKARSRPVKPAAAPTAAPEKVREKLERGRFTLPRSDFERIAALKTRALKTGRPTRKNELFRAGLALLSALSDESLVITLDQLEPTGRKARRKGADPRKRDGDD